MSTNQVGLEKSQPQTESVALVLMKGDGQIEIKESMGFDAFTIELGQTLVFVVLEDLISVLFKKTDQLREQELSPFLFVVLLQRMKLLPAHDWLKRLSSQREKTYTVMNIGR